MLVNFINCCITYKQIALFPNLKDTLQGVTRGNLILVALLLHSSLECQQKTIRACADDFKAAPTVIFRSTND